VKKLVLLSVAALMLAATVFAPAALAHHLGDVESVTLGPGGSVTISGTVQCIEGGTSQVDVVVLQSRGFKPYNTASYFEFIECESTGPVSFTSGHEFAQSPFRKGKATVREEFFVCNSTCELERTFEEIRIR
jgi:hypothetical protein